MNRVNSRAKTTVQHRMTQAARGRRRLRVNQR
jgi:hypothetical protein